MGYLPLYFFLTDLGVKNGNIEQFCIKSFQLGFSKEVYAWAWLEFFLLQYWFW